MTTVMMRNSLCGLLVFLLAAGDGLAWQTPVAKDAERDRINWEKVGAIGPEKQIEVQVKAPGSSSGVRSYRGRLARWEPESLVLTMQKGENREIAKSLVTDVWVKEKGSRGKGAAIGGGVGFGIGMGIGVATYKRLDTHGSGGEAIGIGALFGAIFGGVGALIGSLGGGSRMVQIYHR